MAKDIVVYEGDAKYHRDAYLKLSNDKVVFDCSDGEYGPIQFDIDLLKQALEAYAYEQNIQTTTNP